MVKEVEVATEVDVSVKEFYEYVYSDGQAFARFQAAVGKDPQATAGPWVDGVRKLSFKMKLNIPAMLKSIVGTDSIGVEETQTIIWEGQDKFVIKSQPHLHFPGAQTFKTSGMTTVTSTGARSCKVSCLMTCQASVAWALQGTVEASMVAEAKSSVSKYLDFCKAYALDRKASTQQQQQPAKPHPHKVVKAKAQEERSGEMFFDAYEDEAVVEAEEDAQLLGDGSSSVSASSSAGDVVLHPDAGGALTEEAGGVAYVQALAPHRGPGQSGSLIPRGGVATGRAVQLGAGVSVGAGDQMLVLAVNQLQLAAIESARTMADMGRQMASMAQDIQAIRQVVAPGRISSGGSVAAPQGRSMVMAGFTSGLLLGVATASAVGVMYLRTRQR